MNTSFQELARVCFRIGVTSSTLGKSQILREYFGTAKKGDEDELVKIENACRLLLPGENVRWVFALNNKQLVKIFARIFKQQDAGAAMAEHARTGGDVSETIAQFFPDPLAARHSTLEQSSVIEMLDALANENLTKEADFEKFLSDCCVRRMTPGDLQLFIRLVKKDLRINAGAKVVLDAIAPKAYSVYQTSKDLRDILRQTFFLNEEACAQVRRFDKNLNNQTTTKSKKRLNS
jgi:DNA ligase-3